MDLQLFKPPSRHMADWRRMSGRPLAPAVLRLLAAAAVPLAPQSRLLERLLDATGDLAGVDKWTLETVPAALRAEGRLPMTSPWNPLQSTC